jgi:hypothetical protein
MRREGKWGGERKQAKVSGMEVFRLGCHVSAQKVLNFRFLEILNLYIKSF